MVKKASVFLLFVGLGVALTGCQSDSPADTKAVQAAGKESSGLKRFLSKSTVDIPSGTELRLRIDQTIGTEASRPGDNFSATLESPVVAGAKTVLPKGTRFTGHVMSAKPSGHLKDRGYLTMTLDSFELGGKSYDIDTSPNTRVTGDHKKRNVVAIGGGTGVGALIGGLAGGGKGAAIGAAAGAAAGTAGAAATGQKHVSIPAESVLRFTLKAPVRVEA